MANSEKDGGKGEAEQPKTAEAKPETGWEKEMAIHNSHPNMHWTDVVYQAQRCRVVDLGDQIKGKILKISAEHVARTESQRPVSPQSRQYSVQLGSIAGNLESVQRISGLSPSPRGSAAGIPETNRENDQEEEDAENPESKQQTAQVKEAMHENEFAL